MKKILISAALLMAASSVCAQQKEHTFSITPKVGVAVSNFSGDMPFRVFIDAYSPMLNDNLSHIVSSIDELDVINLSMEFSKRKTKLGFTAGAEARYQASRVFGLSAGAFYTLQGVRYDTKGMSSVDDDGSKKAIYDDLKINMHCITVPVLVSAYVWKGLEVKAGLQPEFAFSKKTSGDVAFSFRDYIVFVSNNVSKGIESLSLSVPVGISYEYKNIVADLRYVIGLTNMSNGGGSRWVKASDTTLKNRTFFFTVGYRFDL